MAEVALLALFDAKRSLEGGQLSPHVAQKGHLSRESVTFGRTQVDACHRTISWARTFTRQVVPRMPKERVNLYRRMCHSSSSDTIKY
jgi:hypothetical protein